ncbi:MAG: hypothetical protein K9G62_05660 [Alphaproteobacteria bacterium]|nr:hypothetical protein [Alphaproteobacteria bacterium]
MTNELVNPKKRKKRRAWPDKHRQKLADQCRRTKPWARSTGPRADDGKAAAAGNSCKHGLRGRDMNELRRVLRLQRDFVRALVRAPAVV